MLLRLSKSVPKPRFFGKTEPNRNQGFMPLCWRFRKRSSSSVLTVRRTLITRGLTDVAACRRLCRRRCPPPSSACEGEGEAQFSSVHHQFMFPLHLTGLVCSSPLPASGRHSWDRRGGEEVRTGHHKMTDGWRASQRLGAYNSASRIVLLHARPQDSRQRRVRREQTFQAFSCSSSSSLDPPLRVIHAYVL